MKVQTELLPKLTCQCCGCRDVDTEPRESIDGLVELCSHCFERAKDG